MGRVNQTKGESKGGKIQTAGGRSGETVEVQNPHYSLCDRNLGHH